MKKFLYITALLLLPVIAFPQNKDRFNTADQTPPAGRRVDIFPNPGNGLFTFVFSKEADFYSSLVVYDNMGKRVFVNEHLNGNPVQADLSKMQAGIYFVVFQSDDKDVRLTERIAIIK